MQDKEHWKQYHKQWERRATIPANPRIIKSILSLFDVKKRKILEIGSGSGRDSIYLAKKGADCYLLDYVQPPLDIAIEVAKQNDVKIKTFKEDARAMSFKDHTFDLVFSQGFMEHFSDPKVLLKEQVRVLKPGGYLYIDVPQQYHIYTLVKHMLMLLNRWKPGWETEYTASKLEKLISNYELQKKCIVGDWSRPPFLLKMVYTICKKDWSTKDSFSKWEKSNPLVDRLKNTRLAQYTFQHIGIIAQKRVIL